MLLTLLVFEWYRTLLQIELTTQAMLLSLGYRRREPIYGSVLFNQVEWVKVDAAAALEPMPGSRGGRS